MPLPPTVLCPVQHIQYLCSSGTDSTSVRVYREQSYLDPVLPLPPTVLCPVQCAIIVFQRYRFHYCTGNRVIRTRCCRSHQQLCAWYSVRYLCSSGTDSTTVRETELSGPGVAAPTNSTVPASVYDSCVNICVQYNQSLLLLFI